MRKLHGLMELFLHKHRTSGRMVSGMLLKTFSKWHLIALELEAWQQALMSCESKLAQVLQDIVELVGAELLKQGPQAVTSPQYAWCISLPS